MAQLAADLLIATLSLKRIAILDPSYCIPAVGGREDGLKGITTPLEREHRLFVRLQSTLIHDIVVFSSPESKVVVIQQRSPVLVVSGVVSSQRNVSAYRDSVQETGIRRRAPELHSNIPVLQRFTHVGNGCRGSYRRADDVRFQSYPCLCDA